MIGQSKAAKPVLDTIIGNEVILMWVTEDGTLHTVALPEPRFVLEPSRAGIATFD